MIRMLSRRAFLGTPALAFAQQRRPNVILIVADDLGFADVGFQGAKDIPTPHLDALAASGVRCTNGYVSHPFCSPTRAGLLTGRYQQRFGHENNPLYDPNDERLGLPLTETLLPQVLTEGGYQTGLVGKWHLGAAPQFHPRKRGFQEHFGFIGGGHDYFEAQMELPAREYLVPVEKNGAPFAMKGKYLTEELTREACEFVGRHRAAPFFLYLAYNAPHTPQHVTDKYMERVKGIASEKRRKHAAMVCSVDDGVGAVMAALREHRLEENTLVFFISDNGGPTGVTEADNGPLRGAKGQVYEGGIRVPFVARWKGRWKAAVYEQPVIALDLFPTICAAAGVAPKGKPLDGANLLPHWDGKAAKAPHERLFWRTGGGVLYAVREGRWKLVRRNDKNELFDLAADVGEKNDVAASQPAVVARLEAARQAWDAQLVKPLFENPQAAKKKA
jgi:arylsulfatase A-like enzyme